MPKRRIEGTDSEYYLVLFDEAGKERDDGEGYLSPILTALVQDGVTDMFLCCHGWQGDIPAAIEQYDRWIRAMVGLRGDLERARQQDPAFKPMVIGVHWPSRPWGDEDRAAALLSAWKGEDDFTAEADMTDEELVLAYSARLGLGPVDEARLRTVVEAAGDDALAAELLAGKVPEELDAAYRHLLGATGLDLDGPAGAPGSDQSSFRPAETVRQWAAAVEGVDDGLGLLGGTGLWSRARDVVLAPVRVLSFWAMKHRARRVGETGVHELLEKVQNAAPRARLHLMGHSFGCIVVSAAAAGEIRGGTLVRRLPRPVQTLYLVQGAMSLWSFAEEIPFEGHPSGFYRPALIDPRVVSGTIATTRSRFDRAVGTFFPLGARAGDELVLGNDEQLPEFGGIGTFGICGCNAGITESVTMLAADARYHFELGHIYNVEASDVIKDGGPPSGAHSDIARPEVAHAFWEAALVSIGSSVDAQLLVGGR